MTSPRIHKKHFENFYILTFFHFPVLQFSEIFQSTFLSPYKKESYHFKLHDILRYDQEEVNVINVCSVLFTLRKETNDPTCVSPCSGTATSSVLGSIKSYTSWSRFRLIL